MLSWFRFLNFSGRGIRFIGFFLFVCPGQVARWLIERKNLLGHRLRKRLSGHHLDTSHPESVSG